MTDERSIAYFSMEVGLRAAMPTYSGGLGVLAGDTIRAAADAGIPMAAVTLLHRRGYFRQALDAAGRQIEQDETWDVASLLHEENARTAVSIENRNVILRCWRQDVRGFNGHVVPVYFLDADIEENRPEDRRLTDHLYGGDEKYRLAQEVILGIGGARMLDVLGHRAIRRYHMNEGHSALLTFELLQVQAAQHGRAHIDAADIEAVRQRCVFTTHTPVPAGHDKFPMNLARQVIGDHPALEQIDEICCEGLLNLTYVALNLSRYVNGVAHRHGEISRLMFAEHEIDSITNGVHASTWTSEPFQRLYDRLIPGWRADNYSLRYALNIDPAEIAEAHRQAKAALLAHVEATAGERLDPEVLTIGFARRATPYKRSDLLFREPERLRQLTDSIGPIQLIFAGKAHPRDEGGKEMIRRVYEMIRADGSLGKNIRGVYLPDYDMDLGALITSGVDVWLNTPQPPMEASGTSGMKAALNGVPSLSVLDGWWIEGCIDGVTGWAIGGYQRGHEIPDSSEEDAESLYARLERDVMPVYYHDRERFVAMMSWSIALNGSFFNTQRMMEQYAVKAYRG